METPGDNQTNQSKPEVTFSIEVRPATSAQVEAGNRLFGQLLVRAKNTDASVKPDIKT